MPTHNQPSAAPTQKVTVGLLAGAVTTIAVYLVKLTAQVEVPVEVGMALTVAITFALQWLVPERG